MKYDKIENIRVRELILEHLQNNQKMNLSKIARTINRSPNMVICHFNQLKPVSIDMARRYAELFETTIDYIYGFTNNRYATKDIWTASDLTGLNTDAITALTKFKASKDKYKLNALNVLITDANLDRVLTLYLEGKKSGD